MDENQNSQSEGPTANTSGVPVDQKWSTLDDSCTGFFSDLPWASRPRFANAFFTLEFGFGQHKFLMYVWSTGISLVCAAVPVTLVSNKKVFCKPRSFVWIGPGCRTSCVVQVEVGNMVAFVKFQTFHLHFKLQGHHKTS